MIQRLSNSSWQIILADLSLILFITTLAAMVTSRSIASDANAAILNGNGLAIYRKTASGVPIEQWLSEVETDPRAQLTILARYSGADRDEIMREAFDYWSAASAHGIDARLVVQAGNRSDVLAYFTYDKPL